MYSQHSMDVIASIGHSLAKKRKIAGLTQVQLAEKSNVSRASIAAIENGAADPKLTTIMSICAGISPNAFNQMLQELWMAQLEELIGDSGKNQRDAADVVSVSTRPLESAATGALLGTVGGPVGVAIGGLLGALLGGYLSSEKNAP